MTAQFAWCEARVAIVFMDFDQQEARLIYSQHVLTGIIARPFKIPTARAVIQRSRWENPPLYGQQLRSSGPADADLVTPCIQAHTLKWRTYQYLFVVPNWSLLESDSSASPTLVDFLWWAKKHYWPGREQVQGKSVNLTTRPKEVEVLDKCSPESENVMGDFSCYPWFCWFLSFWVCMSCSCWSHLQTCSRLVPSLDSQGSTQPLHLVNFQKCSTAAAYSVLPKAHKHFKLPARQGKAVSSRRLRITVVSLLSTMSWLALFEMQLIKKGWHSLVGLVLAYHQVSVEAVAKD